MKPKVSIVIPTFNGGAQLRECLAAIRAQKTAADFEILAVDSGSTDDTLNTLAEFGAQVHRIAHKDFNHGGTRNFALEKAEGELVVLTVQDALPQGEGWLDALITPFADERVAGVYGRQIPRPDVDLMTKRRLAEWAAAGSSPTIAEIADRAEYEKLPGIERYMRCAFDNVCSCIRKSVWREHRFAEVNFAEDVEWARDVLLDGWKIAYEPDAVVMHSHRRPVRYEYRRTYIAARRLYRVFGYSAVHSRREMLHHSFYYVKNTVKMVWHADVGALEKTRNLYRAVALGFLETYAKLRAWRDEQKARPLKKQRGV